jgi:hypothetical protein
VGADVQADDLLVAGVGVPADSRPGGVLQPARQVIAEPLPVGWPGDAGGGGVLQFPQFLLYLLLGRAVDDAAPALAVAVVA